MHDEFSRNLGRHTDTLTQDCGDATQEQVKSFTRISKLPRVTPRVLARYLIASSTAFCLFKGDHSIPFTRPRIDNDFHFSAMAGTVLASKILLIEWHIPLVGLQKQRFGHTCRSFQDKAHSVGALKPVDA